MFITVASDQTMFTYYKPLYGQFKLLTQYPKFGWCGLGPHNENPLLLIRYPIEKSLVEFKEIEKKLDPASELFKEQVEDFFITHMKEVNPYEFITRFVTDRDIIQTAKEDVNMKRVVAAFSINKKYNNVN